MSGHTIFEVIKLLNTKLFGILRKQEISITLRHILESSKADSGGERDVNFLKFLIDQKLLMLSEAVLKRISPNIIEDYYLDKYKKESLESDRHFLCRAIIQDELMKHGIMTISGIDIGNMDILRASSSYDIVLDDFSAAIDVGLTPARNFFRGLTDLKVKAYLITTYFDDYMDDIIFSVFTRSNDTDFLNAVKEYQDGFKLYTPSSLEQINENVYHNNQSPI